MLNASSGCRTREQAMSATPLGLDEVSRFLAVVAPWSRDFYRVWFLTGWRSNEIVALRYGWLNFARQTVILRWARFPRCGGIEAEPKTGVREVDCSYAPEIFEIFERLRSERTSDD